MSTSRSITIIGTILLLWGLTGMAMFVMEYTMDLAELAKTDPVGARIFAAMPGWLWVIFAIAVTTGTLGSVALLMRKSVAALLYLISLICVIIQFGYTFLGTDIIAAKGVAVACGFPAFIFAVGLFSLLYARNLVSKGVLR